MALMALHRDYLDRTAVEETLGCLFKDREDVARMRSRRLDVVMDGIASLDGTDPSRAVETILAKLDREVPA